MTIQIPEILLPKNVDWNAWSVNACDQYTSDLEYWKKVEHIAEGKKSTLNLIYPEIYLKDRPEERIEKINRTMYDYLKEGVFEKVEGGFVLVERTTAHSGKRTGILLAIDLEDYSFEKGAKTLIRSTEATILERIPPRVKIRENAPIELPHIMLLYNDKENVVLNTLKKGRKLYDFDLNMGGGHIEGSYVDNSNEVISAFMSLVEGKKDKFLFAVGDGNHSLATAKTCWNNIKGGLSEEEQKNHPARYALCEAVNIYDSALKFEPIHRFVKTNHEGDFTNCLNISGDGMARICIGGSCTEISFDKNIPDGIRKLDNYISDFIKTYGGEVDYIHGEEELKTLTLSGGVGILLPPIKKNDFFEAISSGGNLPRKTFSMGEGYEKRYYIEAKMIK